MSCLLTKTSQRVWLSRLRLQHTSGLRNRWSLRVQITGKRPFHMTTTAASSSRKFKKMEVTGESPVVEAKRSLIAEILMDDHPESVQSDIDPEIKAFNEKVKRLEQMLYEAERVDEEFNERLADEDVNEDDDDTECVENTPEGTHYLEEIVLDETAGNTVLPLDQTRKMKTSVSDEHPESVSNVPCPGCGALLHCHDPALPGYISVDKYKAIPSGELCDQFCERCHMMRNYNEALALSVDPNLYVKIISKVREVQALTILLVDVTDIEGSLIRNLPSLIGRKRPVFIIGNKVDLLPSESQSYLKHVKSVLESVCKNEGLCDQMYVHYFGLISARTGFGVEELVTKLFRFWSRRGEYVQRWELGKFHIWFNAIKTYFDL